MIKNIPNLMRFLLLVGLLSCGAPKENGSVLHDIFKEDENPTRRHKATATELLWTINMNGCTGHLISPDYMMTANHCSPRSGSKYTSGSALAKGKSRDITVTQVAENDSSLDYAILKISWSGGSAPADQQFPPLVATKSSDVNTSQSPNQGDEIFTVGFPGDKNNWGATYSEGQLKEIRNNVLLYNMGIINGNSGGGVWRKSDKMLVSLTNNGPNTLGQGSWKGASADDSSHWNFGAAMWAVYSKSAILKSVFPDGKNKHSPPSGPSTPDGSRDSSGGGSSSSLFLALEHLDAAGGATRFWLSAPTGTRYAAMCVNAVDCSVSSNVSIMSAEPVTRGNRQLFYFIRQQSLVNDMKITFVTSDSSNKELSKRTVSFKRK